MSVSDAKHIWMRLYRDEHELSESCWKETHTWSCSINFATKTQLSRELRRNYAFTKFSSISVFHASTTRANTRYSWWILETTSASQMRESIAESFDWITSDRKEKRSCIIHLEDLNLTEYQLWSFHFFVILTKNYPKRTQRLRWMVFIFVRNHSL